MKEQIRMAQGISIRFDEKDRDAFEKTRDDWLDQKFGAGSRMDTLPPLGGPISGKMTAHMLESEFVDYLQAKGFRFEII
jgi:hypothetical protein